MIVSATKNCSCCSGVIWVDESNFVYKELWEQLRDSTRLLITIATSLAETQQYASLYRTLKPKPGVRGTLQSLCSVPRPFHLKCEECYWNPSVQSSVKSFQWNVPVSFFLLFEVQVAVHSIALQTTTVVWRVLWRGVAQFAKQIYRRGKEGFSLTFVESSLSLSTHPWKLGACQWPS